MADKREMSLEEIIQNTRIDPLRYKHRQGKKQLVIHRPEAGHNQKKNDKLPVFQDASHIPENTGKRFEQASRILFVRCTPRFLVEQQQDKIQRNNPGRHIKDQRRSPFKKQSDKRPEESPDIHHHIKDAETDGSRRIRGRFGNRRRYDRFEQRRSHRQIQIHKENTRKSRELR